MSFRNFNLKIQSLFYREKLLKINVLQNFARVCFAVLRYLNDRRLTRIANKHGVFPSIKVYVFVANQLAAMTENVDRCLAFGSRLYA